MDKVKSGDVLCKFIEFINLDEEYSLDSLQTIMGQAYNIIKYKKKNKDGMKRCIGFTNFFKKIPEEDDDNDNNEFEKLLSKSV